MTPPEDDTLAPPSRDEGRLPEPEFDPFAEGDELSRSLLDDAEALIADGKTYLEAELEFQKTRAAYVADRAKAAAVYGVVAVLLAFLALIGLVVGLIIALTPLLTAWGASALVVGALLVAALVFTRNAAARWNALMAAIDARKDDRP